MMKPSGRKSSTGSPLDGSADRYFADEILVDDLIRLLSQQQAWFYTIWGYYRTRKVMKKMKDLWEKLRLETMEIEEPSG